MKIHSVKAARKGHRCARGDNILIGEPYSYITPRYGPTKNFCQRHPPRPSDLTSGRLAELYAAQETLLDDLEAFGEGNLDLDGLRASIEQAADEAERIADEYEESIENMPENLQCSPVAEECCERAEAAREWAVDLRDIDLEDKPEQEDGEEDGDYKGRLDEWRQDIASVVEGAWLSV